MIAGRHIVQLALLTGLVLSSCSPQALHEAQRVVAEADSLRTEGVAYTDSMALAEAYNTLEKWQYLYPTDYARACYYYGRLLRNNDDPVAAMQVFINGTHTNTRDYHILGRVYSNMANICRLNSSHDIAFTLHSRSADMFSQAGDTLLYYYGLHNMAYECATLGEKQESLSLIRQIQQQCTDSNVLLLSYETMAEMYRIQAEFDSTIYWINQAQLYGDIGHYGSVIKAQAFDNLGIEDSAIHYATLLLADTTAPYHAKFNALYIISHSDSVLSKDSALAIASQREDIRHYEYEPDKEKLTVAVELLKHDLSRKPFWPWLLLTICLLLIGGGIAGLSRYKKEKRRQLLSQQIQDLQMAKDATTLEKKQAIEKQCKLFASSHNIVVDLCWKDYDALCSIVNQHFLMLALKLQQENLTEKEVRLCVLSLFNLGYEEMADMLCYAPNGIGKFKMRTAKKLGTTAKKMRDFLIEKAINN